MAYDPGQFIERLQQMRRPLQFAARQTVRKIAVLQDLEARLLEWLDAATALQPSPDIVANLDACRRLFIGLDDADPTTKLRLITTALSRLDHLIALVEQRSAGERQHLSLASPFPNSTSPHPEGRSTLAALDMAGGPAAASQAEPPTEAPTNAAASTDVLTQPIQFIKGVGPNRAQMLRRLGIETIADALVLMPRRYEDRTNLKLIHTLQVGMQETFEGTILVSGSSRTGRGKRLYEVIVGDATGTIRCLWFQFHEAYMRQRYRTGQRVIVSGEIRINPYSSHRKEVHHPDLEIMETEEREPLHVGRIVPVYPATEGLHQKTLRSVIKRIVDDYAPQARDCLPPTVRERLHLMMASQALREVHFPPADADLEALNRWSSPAHRRLVFEEFFLLELGLALRQRETTVEERGVSYRGTGTLAEQLRMRLPFQLTAAQERVLAEILENMRRPHPMNRLLQGDVGSGKTIVALLAMLLAIESGFQAAIMAPTEILAEQHYLTMERLVHALGVRVTLLTSAIKGGRRRSLLEAISAGDVDLIVGTHALIQEGVAFKGLGLAVIDEQHRFGVLQRATLKHKGYSPDVLVMTATPIPRTLAMTVYGDLDVSIIDELPPGRLPVLTRLGYESRRGESYDLMRQELRRGRQAYVVYPLIEESEKTDLRAATAMAEQLQREVFPEFRVGLLHGRLRSDDKEHIMRAFSAGDLRVLVSTTVIEVGVDVPNATVMLVEHAERFGLAQLHQLRGRVGRSCHQAYCLLMADFPMSEEAKQRLQALRDSHDGFVIAERDLEIRGPGEFLGTRQSGLPELRVAHLIRDQRILAEARREAFTLVAEDPHLSRPEHAALRQALVNRWRQSFELMHVG
ncbi:MAG TPA: ATP-dependent DNA helicase RecG [Candidatus Tectomicrobia bacterium]|nr:ATP-dependent DNA helicase RecG [Candidatus Tectomicrobia bacterium]